MMRIVSGGQTGVDRAALDVALALGIPCGDWCPQGRKADDGRISLVYPLQETSSSAYADRTEKNVIDSDGTLIVCVGKPRGGTYFTLLCAQKHGKPYYIVDLAHQPHEALASTRAWLQSQRIAVLNIAGPRESEHPGIYDVTSEWLRALFQKSAGAGGEDDIGAAGGDGDI